MQSVSFIFFKLLALCPISLPLGLFRVHGSSEFQEDTVFALHVERDTIRSTTLEGGNFFLRQIDSLLFMKQGDLFSKSSSRREEP